MAVAAVRLPRRIVTEQTRLQSFTRRTLVLGGAQAALATLLGGRMAWLAIAENERYRTLSESNRVQQTMIPPRRGWIVDRHGRPLAINRTNFRVDLIPDRIVDAPRIIADLRRLLGLTDEEVERVEAALAKGPRVRPVPVKENIDYERFAALSVHQGEMPGVAPASGSARFYPSGAAVGHLLGYVGPASAADYEKTRDPLLVTPGFKIGKEGLERTLEPWLRGRPGAKRSEVTAHGRIVAELTTRPEVVGRTLQLTIDGALQRYAARRLGPNSGSAVVMDTHNGEILAMASMPSYDPNSFSDGISHSEWNMLSASDHVPLMNKVLQGLYPPGSTVKPMNALALLQGGVDPRERVFCSGAYRLGRTVFHCHKRRGHGPLDMRNAIMQSCDVYFYTMVRRLGIDRLAVMMRAMGLGQRFDLPFTSQRYGTVPDTAWKARKYHRAWTVADTINASIGQGYTLVNPLQLAVMAARLASGRALDPRLIANRRYPPLGGPIGASEEHLAIVRDAMWGVVNGGGTGGSARMQVPGVALAGKTGTAQVRRISMAERRSGVLSDSATPFKLRDHSLFVGFAPFGDPRYACAVVLEHSGHLTTAAPMARDILTFLFEPQRALRTVEALEAEWGGGIEQRMAAEAAEWRIAHEAAPRPLPPPPEDAPAAAPAPEGRPDEAAVPGTSPPPEEPGDNAAPPPAPPLLPGDAP